MGEARGAAARAGVAAGLVLGAGACYCVYRLARSRRAGAAAGTEGAASARDGSAPGGGLLPRVSGLSVLSSLAWGGPSNLQSDTDLPKSPSNLDAHHLQKLIHLLELTDDPLIQEQALVTLSNSAAFSVNQDIIRNLDGLSVIGKMLSNSIPKVKEKALNTLNNLSMNVKNQEEIKVYILQVCKEIELSPLNSDLQLAELRLLTNMSVTNDYHHMMTNAIPCFLHLLSEGNERTQIQVLKVLVNLSANPAMTRHLFSAQAPSLLSLFDNCINKEILLRALMFAANLNENMKNEEGIITQDQYSEDSVFSLLCGHSTQYTKKLMWSGRIGVSMHQNRKNGSGFLCIHFMFASVIRMCHCHGPGELPTMGGSSPNLCTPV
ncbi:armadillo repeat-containing protein 10 [Trachemys scripta elegans]|uniref:armadillo repeat-containing protein 10 n=1 Tax=Trachemys scripta elegans TaxID=31138 RepID=UPI0015517C75|nr:armadillo repeat-containing protein 10 [Trachemys scripta elegans]